MEDQAKRRGLLLSNALPTHQNSHRLAEKTKEGWTEVTRAGDGDA